MRMGHKVLGDLASRWRSYITASLRAGYPKGNVVAQGGLTRHDMEDFGIGDHSGDDAGDQALTLDAELGAPALSRYVDLMGRTLGARWRLTKDDDEQLVVRMQEAGYVTLRATGRTPDG